MYKFVTGAKPEKLEQSAEEHKDYYHQYDSKKWNELLLHDREKIGLG